MNKWLLGRYLVTAVFATPLYFLTVNKISPELLHYYLASLLIMQYSKDLLYRSSSVYIARNTFNSLSEKSEKYFANQHSILYFLWICCFGYAFILGNITSSSIMYVFCLALTINQYGNAFSAPRILKLEKIGNYRAVAITEILSSIFFVMSSFIIAYLELDIHYMAVPIALDGFVPHQVLKYFDKERFGLRFPSKWRRLSERDIAYSLVIGLLSLIMGILPQISMLLIREPEKTGAFLLAISLVKQMATWVQIIMRTKLFHYALVDERYAFQDASYLVIRYLSVCTTLFLAATLFLVNQPFSLGENLDRAIFLIPSVAASYILHISIWTIYFPLALANGKFHSLINSLLISIFTYWIVLLFLLLAFSVESYLTTSIVLFASSVMLNYSLLYFLNLGNNINVITISARYALCVSIIFLLVGSYLQVHN